MSHQQPAQTTNHDNLSTRKKRRGMIEKKRRDKINHSLCELRRLVPAAYEKQGAAKLEKAEILQMTVDYLKMLHAKGLIECRSSPQLPITTSLTQHHHLPPKHEQLEVSSPIHSTAHISAQSLSPVQQLQSAQQQQQQHQQSQQQPTHQPAQQLQQQQEQLFASHHHHQAHHHHHQQQHLNHSHLSNAHNYHHQLATPTSEHLAAAAAAATYHNPVQYYYNL